MYHFGAGTNKQYNLHQVGAGDNNKNSTICDIFEPGTKNTKMLIWSRGQTNITICSIWESGTTKPLQFVAFFSRDKNTLQFVAFLNPGHKNIAICYISESRTKKNITFYMEKVSEDKTTL